MADDTTSEEHSATQRATEVAGTARDQAKGVATSARDEASAVASEAGAQARTVVDEARSALQRQASDGTHRAAGALGEWGGRFRALAEGEADQAGELGRYAAELGDRLDGWAARVDERGLDGLVDDVQRFARRRPGVFLAVAAASGFAAGRLFRGARGEAGNGDRPADQRRGAALEAAAEPWAPPPPSLAGAGAGAGPPGVDPAGPATPPASPVPDYGGPAPGTGGRW